MNKISGVYKITNTITGEFYIGSSKDIEQRWRSHKSLAFHHKHQNLKIYQDMDKYGNDKFMFEIIEETSDLREREQYWIDELKPTYNIRPVIGMNETQKKAYKKTYAKEHDERLCEFEGEILRFSALRIRFARKGIASPTQEAKKYLLK